MLLDNKNHGKVISELRKNIKADANLSVLCGLFSIYGYEFLKKELTTLSRTRLILSKWNDDYLRVLSGQLNEIRFKNHLDQPRVARECAVWVQKQVQVRALIGIDAGQLILMGRSISTSL